MRESKKYELHESGVYLPKNYQIFKKPSLYDITNRQYEQYKETAEFIQWGRRNPTRFASEIFGVELMDYQTYIFMNTWTSKVAVWAMSRNGGKSALASIYLMTKSLLVPNFTAYILCGVGSQSIEMYSKLEKITKNEVPSFTTLTSVYASEIIKSHANKDGFVHNPASYHHQLYNDAQIFTLNGAYNNNRSKRSNCNVYDEAMNSPDELFDTSEPFTTQNADFALGTNGDGSEMLMKPPMFENQLLYCSSAGRTDQYFYKKYRECSLRMDAGDKNYFCADISCDVIIKATKRGIGLPKPLLSQSTVDSAMRTDKEAALREYYNIFTNEGGDGQIIKRARIIKNSYNRIPVLKNPDGRREYVFAYDPARSHDNSALAIGELYEDPTQGLKMKIVNLVCLQDYFKANKTPMNTPNQIKAIKQLLLDYNGDGVADYQNIKRFLVDAGSGGAGVPITDFFLEDWEDSDGLMHRGLIDKEYSAEEARNFPNAIPDIVKLMSPLKYKSEMFESLIQMMDLGLIEFPNEYDGKGFINLIYEIDKNGNRTLRDYFPSEDEEKILNKKEITVDTQIHKLTTYEEIALRQIDHAKTELVNIYRFKQASGKDRFDLDPQKANKMHDDRAYVIAMLAWELAQRRREHITKRKPKKTDYTQQFINIRPAKFNWKQY